MFRRCATAPSEPVKKSLTSRADRRKRLSHVGTHRFALLWGRRFRLPTEYFTASYGRGSDQSRAQRRRDSKRFRGNTESRGTLRRLAGCAGHGPALLSLAFDESDVTVDGQSCEPLRSAAG